MPDPRVQRCLGSGTSVLVGTVDAQGFPSCCRGVAIRPADDLKTVAVFIPVATSQRIIQDVATTHRLAVSVTHIIEHYSIQLKGTATTARLARDDEARYVTQHYEAFSDVLLSVGMPKRLTRRLTHWPVFVVDLTVEEIYEQTDRKSTRLN